MPFGKLKAIVKPSCGRSRSVNSQRATPGALTLAGLGGFALGLRVQDRLEQQAFNRVVLVFLALLGAWLVMRGG